MHWYYSKNGTQLGPVSEGELLAKLASGEVSAMDMVWKEGMADWQPAGTVAALASLQALPPVANSPYSPPVFSSAPMPGGTQFPVSSPPTSGLAIASLICGILGIVTCLFLPGIPAVICGHMALRSMAGPSVRLDGRGMAIAGLITGYISIATLVGFVVVMTIAVTAASTH